MSKVTSIYVEPLTESAVDNNPANRGSISAYKMVQARGFGGMSFMKRVRIGVEFGVTVETAKDMMRDIRNNNKCDNGYPAADILGRFVMEM